VIILEKPISPIKGLFEEGPRKEISKNPLATPKWGKLEPLGFGGLYDLSKKKGP